MLTPPFTDKTLGSPALPLPQATHLWYHFHAGDGYALSQASFRNLCSKHTLSLGLVRTHRFGSTRRGHAYHGGTEQNPSTAIRMLFHGLCHKTQRYPNACLYPRPSVRHGCSSGLKWAKGRGTASTAQLSGDNPHSSHNSDMCLNTR